MEQYPTIEILERGVGPTDPAIHAAGKKVEVGMGFYGVTRGIENTAKVTHDSGSAIPYFYTDEQRTNAMTQCFAHECGHSIHHAGERTTQSIMHGSMSPGSYDGNGVYHTYDIESKRKFRVKPYP